MNDHAPGRWDDGDVDDEKGGSSGCIVQQDLRQATPFRKPVQ